ncbi:GNAT family N-acetyltransferase [Mesorhizobium sp. NPDC059025]|uniref:GNAT family N-acetyltransferase n=1 Tax=unclassified Mesorhizobium TaxID=325217 RepID=UPI00368E6B04
MAEISFLSLAHVPLAEACATLNAGYEGYVVPVAFDPVSLARRIQAEHIDLVASQLLRVDDRSAGIMLIARRGHTSRLAALGIAAPLRGTGIGARAVAAAIAEARSRGDLRLVLEVIDSNTKAISTYTKAGFAPRRKLAGYTHDPVPPAAWEDSLMPCAADDILPLLLGAWPDDASWQTSPLCFAGATKPIEAFRAGDAAALVDASGQAVRLLAFAVRSPRQGIGRRFMQSLLARFADRPWTIPATLPATQAAGFLAATGWKQSALSQLEMELRPG